MRLAGISCAVPRHAVAFEQAYDLFPREEVDKVVRNSGLPEEKVPSRLVLVGFGVGLSGSAVALHCQPFACLPLIEV